jgi:hypothetical protein
LTLPDRSSPPRFLTERGGFLFARGRAENPVKNCVPVLAAR